jgi:hypothetical protein
MADVDVPGTSDGQPGAAPPRSRMRRRTRRRRRLAEQRPLESLEQRESRRGARARQAAGMAVNGPWQWQWRRQHRRRRTVGCMLWILTLLAVLLVLSLLFGGLERGRKTGGIHPPGPVPAQLAAPPVTAFTAVVRSAHERHPSDHRQHPGLPL